MTKQPSNPTKIVTTGTWLSSSNIGDNAIFCGLLDTLPGAEFTVLTADPERVREIYQVKAYAPKKHPFRVLLSLIKTDYLFFTGGTPLFNDPLHMAYFATLAILAKVFGKTVAVFGVSYRKAEGLAFFFVQMILWSATLVGAREYGTLETLQGLGLDKKKVKFLPDPGFFQEPTRIAPGKEIISKLESAPSSYKIGICLRTLSPSGNFQEHHYSRNFSEDTLHAFYEHIANFVEYTVEKNQARIFFLPMHIHPPDDDRIAAEKVVDCIGKPQVMDSITTVHDQLSPREMKWLFSELDLVIGVRFHSIVLAASTCTPVISIGYAKKNQDLLELLALSPYATEVGDVTSPWLISMYHQVKENQEKIEEHLSAINEKFKNTYTTEIQQLFRET